MEYLNTVLAILGGAGGVGGVALVVRNGLFYFKAAKQARDSFEGFRTANKKLYADILADPDKKELAKVLSGGVKKIEALTGLDL